MSTRIVEIVRRSDSVLVEATLVDNVAPDDLVLVERAWTTERARIQARLRASAIPRTQWPESWHWDWAAKAPELRQLSASGFGIIADADDWQGLILVKTAPYEARIQPDRGKPLVYVDYIEIAPWNWRIPSIGEEGRYKGVGSILFREAVKFSIGEGFHGRVGLHALPQAEAFYEGVCGMTALSRDPGKQNLLYFEFTKEQAKDYLEKGGVL